MRPTPTSLLLLLAFGAALAAGCSSARRPATPTNPTEFGEASWYGIEERGRLTANGEPMNPGGMTAAHPSLPFGTIVEVTDVATGQSVEVRINDRGPFVDGRIIDLSHEAARRLGILQQGVAPVMLTVIERAPVPVFTVQVGAYRSARLANELSQQLQAAGYGGAEVVQANGVHRVRVGRFSTRRDADVLASGLEADGHDVLVLRLRL